MCECQTWNKVSKPGIKYKKKNYTNALFWFWFSMTSYIIQERAHVMFLMFEHNKIDSRTYMRINKHTRKMKRQIRNNQL